MSTGWLRDTQTKLRDIDAANQPKEPMSAKDELVAKVNELIATVVAENSTSLGEARKALNEAGIGAARKHVMDALGHIDTMQTGFREQQEVERQARQGLDQAIAEAEWELDARFVAASNKTWLIVDPQHQPIDAPENLKPMTADERKEWKRLEARSTPGVQQAEAAHRSAAADLDASKDAVAHADRAFSAARGDLTAAIAHLTILSQAIGAN